MDASADANFSVQDATNDGAQASDGSADASHDASTAPSRSTYSGTLDASGNATISIPEIVLADMPLVVGYVYSSAYAEPGYVPLGNIIPGTGTFRFAAGQSNGGAQYVVVVLEAERVVAGTLDANGDTTVSVPEIVLANMPLVVGYVHTNAYAEPGYVSLGNIVPGAGAFRFAAGVGNANADFRLVVAHGASTTSGTLDSSGNASVSVPAIELNDMPATLGYVWSTAYAVPGYVRVGNIIPGGGQFRFAAGAPGANASFILAWSD